MEIQIGQDIRKYKTKDIGNFSFKEAAFLATGVAIGYAAYKISGGIMEAAIFPAGIVMIFGFFKPYGLTCTQFIKTVLAENLTPQCYINETDFVYNEEEVKKIYDDVVIPAEWNVIQTNTTAKINKQDRSKLIR